MIQSKKTLLAALFFPIIILLGVTSYRIYLRETGVEVTLPITGYDPRSLLSGHYMVYQIEYGVNDICKIPESPSSFICLDSKTFTNEKPASCKKLIEGRCRSGRFQAGVERFYVPQELAAPLEKQLAQNKAKIVLSLASNGKAVIKDLLVNGKSWKVIPHQGRDMTVETLAENIEAPSPEAPESGIAEIDLSKEDLSSVDLSSLARPLPQRISSGAKLDWFVPFEAPEGGTGRRRNRRELESGALPGKPILISGESVLTVEKITRDSSRAYLHIRDDRQRTFVLSLTNWLRDQYTSASDHSLVAKLVKKKSSGVPLVFNNCMEKIGELKHKCFEFSFAKDPSFTSCPALDGFPQYIAESIQSLCGHVKDPTLTVRKVAQDTSGSIYVVDGELETLFYLVKLKVAEIEDSRLDSIERLEQWKQKQDAQDSQRLTLPMNFGSKLEALARAGKMDELKSVIIDGQKTKLSSGESVLDNFMKDPYSSGKDVAIKYFMDLGDWSYALDYFIAPDSMVGRFAASGRENIIPDEALFLRLLFTSDYTIADSLRTVPGRAKKWEEFAAKHDFLEIKAHYSLFKSPLQGAIDPTRPLIKKFGLEPDFEKLKSLRHSASTPGLFPRDQVLALVSKYPFAVDLLGENYKSDGVLCDKAVEAELKSKYFANGVCRLLAVWAPTNSDCVPRKQYPPNGEGYYDKCKDNFRAWVRKTYPANFKK